MKASQPDGKERKSIGLNKRIALLFIAIIIVLISSMGLTLYFYFANNVETSILSSLSLVIDNNAANVNDLIVRVDLATSIINSSNAGFVRQFAIYSGDLIQEFPIYEQVRDQFRNYMSITLGRVLTRYRAFLFVDDSMGFSQILSDAYITGLTSYYGDYNAVLNNNHDVAGEAWFRKATDLNGQLYWFRFESAPDMIYVAQLLHQMTYTGIAVRNDTLGVILIGMDATWIRSRIDSGQLTGGTRIILADQDQQIIYADDAVLKGLKLNDLFTAEVLENAGKDGMVRIVLGNVPYFAKIKQMAQGLSLITMIPASDIQSITRGTVGIIGIIVPVMLIAGIILITVISRRVVQPIKKLSDHMNRLPNDLSQIPGAGVANDEVGILYRSFNILMLRIRQLIDEVYQTAEQKKAAELKTLQAQINPHFVYNTLDSVCCISLMRGEDDIADTLSSLAYMMRYNIKQPDEMVTIARELEMINHYINIQKLRYDDRLTILVQTDLDADCWLIPKMIIQPLVENALIYGVNRETNTVVVSLTCRELDQSIEIIVEDEGPGDQAAAINGHLSGENNLASESGGFGIRNVQQRIQMKFGDKYGLHYEQNASGRMSAVILIPKVSKNPE